MSEWHLLTQEDLDAFAALTGVEWSVDLDVERSKQARFGGTIARGCGAIARGYYPRALGRASRGRARRRRS